MRSNAVELCGHDEVVLAQAFNLLGLQRDGDVGTPRPQAVGITRLARRNRTADLSMPFGAFKRAVGQCSRIDPVTLGSWSNSAPNPYQSAIAVRQRSSAITGLTHSLGVVGSIANVPSPPLFTKSGSIMFSGDQGESRASIKMRV